MKYKIYLYDGEIWSLYLMQITLQKDGRKEKKTAKILSLTFPLVFQSLNNTFCDLCKCFIFNWIIPV